LAKSVQAKTGLNGTDISLGQKLGKYKLEQSKKGHV